jgi:hypothetical protein
MLVDLGGISLNEYFTPSDLTSIITKHILELVRTYKAKTLLTPYN